MTDPACSNAPAASREDLEPILPRRRGCFGLFMALMLTAGALWGAALGGFLWMVDHTTSRVSQAFADFRPKVGSRVYSSDGEELGEFTLEARRLVRLSEIPLHVQKAVLATEDARFYAHRGVRIDALFSALRDFLVSGQTRGASTITMQVVRNVEPLEVGQERTIFRKLREMVVALQIERQFTKDEILELYLNQVFLGISAHGVDAAARQYFGVGVEDLTIGEAATIAGLLRSPNRNNPITNLKNALARRNIVLDQMFEEGFITAEERDKAKAEDLEAQVNARFEKAARLASGNVAQFQAPYFSEEVRQFLMERFGRDEVFQEGLQIQTTIDMRLQRVAERVLKEALDAFDEKQRKRLEKEGKLDEFMPVSGALVCLDNRSPWEGYVRAMVGGRDFTREKYNTATQARRQPGSSIKPFIWAAAIGNGFTPSSIVVDAPYYRPLPGGRVWAPKNFGGTFSGPIPIRHALEKSVNIVSIKLAEAVGVPVVRSLLERCGIPTDVEGLAIALGAGEVRPLDHCAAYAVFPLGGQRYEPVFVTEVRDRDGLARLDTRDRRAPVPAMDPRVAYVTLHMMEGVCQPGDGFYPTGWRASALKRPVAGKTGTTNDSRDAWFCGFTRQYTTVVWVGYRDNRPLGRGADYTGGRLACPIWVEFMSEAHEGLPVEDFEVPPGVTFYKINRMTGTLGGSYEEAFLAGTRPPEYVPPPPPEEPVPLEGTVVSDPSAGGAGADSTGSLPSTTSASPGAMGTAPSGTGEGETSSSTLPPEG
ncbi:MAG TPA: PBP1A family penicillin-binding protein [Candidatus Hydrogenedentes bacterium]|nr:PBP1A family penicillin-binding protein [Candidatus Hydrogenedentota bacterium]